MSDNPQVTPGRRVLPAALPVAQRKRIGVDLDGVIYRWDATAAFLLRYYRGANVLGESPHWDYLQNSVTNNDWQWLWTRGVEYGLFRHGHVYRGSIEALRYIKALGHSISIITSRPEKAEQDTLDWLSFNRIPASEVHVVGPKNPKSVVKCDYYIDDGPHVTKELVNNTEGWVCLWDRPWNQDTPIGDYTTRLYTWDQFFTLPGIGGQDVKPA